MFKTYLSTESLGKRRELTEKKKALIRSISGQFCFGSFCEQSLFWRLQTGEGKAPTPSVPGSSGGRSGVHFGWACGGKGSNMIKSQKNQKV